MQIGKRLKRNIFIRFHFYLWRKELISYKKETLNFLSHFPSQSAPVDREKQPKQVTQVNKDNGLYFPHRIHNSKAVQPKKIKNELDLPQKGAGEIGNRINKGQERPGLGRRA